MKSRVVVTGVGLVTPLGIDTEKSWQALCRGQSGIGPVTNFDASALKSQVAGEVKDFHAPDYMDLTFIRRFDPFVQFAVAASTIAVEDSQFKKHNPDPHRVGVVIGTAFGINAFFETSHMFIVNNNPTKVPPFFIVNNSGNIVAGAVAIKFGAKGPNHCLMEACAAGTNAIGMGFRLIQNGEADIVIAGGTDAGVTPTCFSSTDVLGALTSKRNDQPEKASRPFDSDRDGFVLSEGSGMLVLETLESALYRGAKIYGEIIGFGHNCDAYHVTSPSPGGTEQANCMKLALRDAEIKPHQVDYINAHGTATVLNDVSETKAIKKAFGTHAYKIPISSNKSMIGHLCGAAGAVEAVFSLLTLRDGIVPPTINLDNLDPDCDLDYVPNTARKSDINIILSNSFGFGGINGALALKKYTGS